MAALATPLFRSRSSSAVPVSVVGCWRLLSHCWTRTRTRTATSCRSLSDRTGEKNTHFGFETVPEAEKAKKVYKVFENVAQKYDVMNDAMSLGIHRLWKDALLHVIHPQPGACLLDVAGGTGDIALRFLDYVDSQKERQAHTPARQPLSGDDKGGVQTSRAVVCDINREMLKVGKEKARHRSVSANLSWVVGDAEELPFDDQQFDIYTVAFGIRNVTRIELALQEAHRVLKPGGRFVCLEFSKVTHPLLASLYDAYSFQVIPVLGEVIAGDWKSYQYLVESIRKFPAQEEFKDMMEDAGLCCVRYHNLTGGVVALHSGFKL
ncbi:2-methoxy-6-polyprenyl-1,4-benzoquinol methylase, mitochondrial [Corythoichthys intestinalis]|uniref:2-methoxy-6-polyprenyl-1,4-benzoquinol methylase, mitochondrial n=1 Tax=Corythoichthys intestinalis TaxID=161448 RepID=UPI0025A4E596|nr:2-methoxy-6-polyprenyl-1,4-benzoquinol methylase, mitochondrial [Corythoichthys intestinalis]XP_061803851.1 2-methoxy-6-polyprenyl-1,4-benzoquinol methylase, mitochondrial-like [Nerophis lumbriciformis]